MVFQTLNKMKWTGKLNECKISIKYRNEFEKKKIISGKNIVELKKTYFIYKSRTGDVFIPLHRVIEIHYKNTLIWKRGTS